MNDKNKVFYKKLGENLRTARLNKGYTLQQVSSIMKRGVATISDNELGKTEIPFSVIMEYCKVYDVDINEITPKH